MKTDIAILFCLLTLTSSGQSDQQIISRRADIQTKFFLANAAETKKDTATAIRYYKEVIEMIIPDNIDWNYRYSSAKRLAHLCFVRKQYEETILYLDLSKKFPSGNWCGNGVAEEAINMADLYSTCYIGLGNFKKAISILTTQMFKNAWADNSRIIPKLYSTYSRVYSNEEIKNAFTNADNTLELKKTFRNHEVYFKPTIKIFEDEIPLPLTWNLNDLFGYRVENEKEYRKKCKAFIESSEIYKLATM